MKITGKIILTLISVLFLLLGVLLFQEAEVERTGFILLAVLLNPFTWKLLNKKKAIVFPILLVCAAGILFLAEYSASTNTWRINWDSVSFGDKKIPADTPAEDILTVHFVDIGQGDATLITCGGQSMLIDAGENDKGTAVQLYLKKQGIEKLDYVIATHPDSDHIGGMDVILTKYDCETVLMPDVEKNTDTYRDMMEAASYRGQTITHPVPGDSFFLGEAEFTILAPNGDYGENYNDWSLGILLTHGSNRFVFTGDAEGEAEKDIASGGIDISCDVYKAGHHGSGTSSSEELLDAMNPGFAVISCGIDNDYGHPNKEVLERFREKSIRVFRTDTQGNIVARSDGDEITWETQKQE